MGQTAVLRTTPALDDLVELPAGRYTLGEPGEEREVELARVLIGRYPVCNEHVGRHVGEQLADHPATDLTRDEAEAFAAARNARLPTADEWEALARGADARAFPWGETFDETRCNCAEALWGWTVPVTAHPAGASPFGAEQLAGNVWEWVADRTPDGWGIVKGGSYLDTGWGLRAARSQSADPARATPHHRLPHRRRPREECMTADRPAVLEALKEVYDPCCADRGISIVDMGVVEDVRVTGPTSMSTSSSRPGGAPSWRRCRARSPTRSRHSPGVDTVDVQVVWDPVWTMDRLSPSAREKLEMPLDELEPYRAARSAA